MEVSESPEHAYRDEESRLWSHTLDEYGDDYREMFPYYRDDSRKHTEEEHKSKECVLLHVYSELCHQGDSYYHRKKDTAS